MHDTIAGVALTPAIIAEYSQGRQSDCRQTTAGGGSMLRLSLALLFALLSSVAQAQSTGLVVSDATRRVAVFTSYCGGVRAEWAAFRPHFDTFGGHDLERSEGTLGAVEFTVSQYEISVFDKGSGRLQCSTYTVAPDASEYVASLTTALHVGEPQYVRSGNRDVWLWSISPSSPDGRQGWRWVKIDQERMSNANVIMITYFNYTPG